MQRATGEEAEVCTDEGYFLYSAVAVNVSLQRMLLIQLLFNGQMMFVFLNNSKHIKKKIWMQFVYMFLTQSFISPLSSAPE